MFCINCHEELPPERRFLCGHDCWVQYNYYLAEKKRVRANGADRYCRYCYKIYRTHNVSRHWCSKSCEIKDRKRKTWNKLKSKLKVKADVTIPLISIQWTEPNMQSLYNCKQIDKDHYRVTKFDSGLVPFEDHEGRVSSYTCTHTECDCPQGHKPTCRHRKMLPFFVAEDHIDDNYFFCWDTHQWIKATGIFAEAAEANEPKKLEDDPLLTEVTPQEIELLSKRVAQAPASVAPSPRPSTGYRRTR